MSYFIKKLESTYIKWIQTLPYQLISNTDHSIDYNIVHCPYFDFVGVWLLGGCDFNMFRHRRILSDEFEYFFHKMSTWRKYWIPVLDIHLATWTMYSLSIFELYSNYTLIFELFLDYSHSSKIVDLNHVLWKIIDRI